MKILLRLCIMVILCCTTSLIKSESFIAPQKKAKMIVPVKPLLLKKQTSKLKYWAEAFFIRL